MSTSLILYQGEPVACTGGRRAYLTRELLLRPDDDPDRRFVLAMCLFALEVAHGHRAGPYTPGCSAGGGRAGVPRQPGIERPAGAVHGRARPR